MKETKEGKPRKTQKKEKGQEHRRVKQGVIDRIVVVEVLVDGENEQSEIGQDHPELGEEIIETADFGGIAGETLRLAQGIYVGEGDGQERQQEGEEGQPSLLAEGPKENYFHQKDHEGERKAVLLGLHGKDGGEQGGPVPKIPASGVRS